MAVVAGDGGDALDVGVALLLGSCDGAGVEQVDAPVFVASCAGAVD